MIEWIGSRLARLGHVYVESLPALFEGFLMAMLLMLLAWLIERQSVGREQSSLAMIAAHPGSARNDILAALLKYTGLHSYIGMLMSLGLIYILVRAVRHQLAPLSLTATLTPIQAGLLYFLVADLVHYAFHRFSHVNPVHWSIHRFHHSASAMTIVNANREHPLGQPVGAMWLLLPMALAPPPEYQRALFAAALALQFHGFLTHSNMVSTWGWIGEYVLVSPLAHRMHHGLDPRFHNCNYGGTLVVWDRMFGSYCSPSGLTNPRFAVGLKDDAGNSPPLRYVLDTYCETLVCLRTALDRLWRLH